MLQFCRNRLKVEQNCRTLPLMLVQNYTCLDVRKILCMWPSHAFMKFIIFGVCLPCPSTGMRLHLRDGSVGHVHPWDLVFSALFCTTTHWSISFLLFVCDNNTSCVVTFAIKNIQTKAHQYYFSNLQKLWPTFLFIANLILLANTPTPDLAQYHFE